jgi:hypothetical protein
MGRLKNNYFLTDTHQNVLNNSMKIDLELLVYPYIITFHDIQSHFFRQAHSRHQRFAK